MTPPAASSRRFLATSVSSAFFSLWAMERGTSTMPVIHEETSSWFTFCVCEQGGQVSRRELNRVFHIPPCYRDDGFPQRIGCRRA